jgi:hypothetical protein
VAFIKNVSININIRFGYFLKRIIRSKNQSMMILMNIMPLLNIFNLCGSIVWETTSRMHMNKPRIINVLLIISRKLNCKKNSWSHNTNCLWSRRLKLFYGVLNKNNTLTCTSRKNNFSSIINIHRMNCILLMRSKNNRSHLLWNHYEIIITDPCERSTINGQFKKCLHKN